MATDPVERVVPFDLGCQPSPSGSAEILLSGIDCTFVSFLAISTEPGAGGKFLDLGKAVVRCDGRVAARHGYPNDEGLPEHALWHKGLSDLG